MTSNNYFGTCQICGGSNKKLLTTKTSRNGITYWIKKSCNHCQDVIQNEINHAFTMLRCDQRQLEESNEDLYFIPHNTGNKHGVLSNKRTKEYIKIG